MAARTVKVIWEAQARQAALISSPCFEILFGGARGGGKTDGMLGDFISHADLYGENAIGLMVRRERTQLLETIERSKQIYGMLGWKFHEQDKMWRSPNGARLRFAYLERDSDADAYQGHSYSRVYVEEIGTFPSEKPILKLMATLRSGAGVPCGFRATGNPGGPGHHWVKARYIDQAPLGWKVTKVTYKNPWTQEEITRDRVFIPSKLQDNKYLGADYVANLQMSGSANLVRAWLEGDWSVIEGAFFPEWSNEKHVIRPCKIPNHWLRFRSMDWGSASPFSIGWWAVAGDDTRLVPSGELVATGNGATPHHDSVGTVLIPRGALVRYREWYGASSPNVGLKMPAEEVAQRILAKEQEGEIITYGVLDPAAFSSDGGPSIAERLARNGVRFRPADNKRVAQRGALGGWDQVRSRLIGSDERPSIYFFSTCVDSIRTLPALQHDTDKPEDVDTHQEDHACFAAGTSVGGYDIAEIGVLTKSATDVVSVRLSNGAQIVCTPNHRFLGANGQWIAAKDLSQILLFSPRQFNYSRVSGITDAALTFSAKAVDCIAWFGRKTREVYQRASTSIIWTATLLTTPLKILPFWSRSITFRGMGVRMTSPLRLKPYLRRQTGIVPRKEESGTQAITRNTLDRYRYAWSPRLARIAGRLSRQSLSMRVARSFAGPTVKPVHCVSVEPHGKANVYCIGKQEGYFELDVGVVVSNCDEIRYACMSRPYVKEIPKKPQDKLLSIGPQNQVTLEDLYAVQPSRRKSERV